MGNVVTINGVEKRVWKASTSVKEAVLPHVKDFEGQPLGKIDEYVATFKTMQLHSHIDVAEFAQVFQLPNDAPHFNVFKTGRLVDANEVFGSLSICATASLNEILKWNFRFYDVNERGKITRVDLMNNIDSVMKGMCKLTGGILPVPAERNAIFRGIFNSARFNSSDEITYAEYSRALQHSDEVRQIITHFPVSSSNDNEYVGLFGAGMAQLPKILPAKVSVTGERHDSAPLDETREPQAKDGLAVTKGSWKSARNLAAATKKNLNPSTPICGKSSRSLTSKSPRGTISRGKSARNVKESSIRNPSAPKRPTAAARSRRQKQIKTSWKYPKEDVLILSERFRHLDADNSGSISLLEFLESLPDTHQTFGNDLFQAVDTDFSGEISFPELMTVLYPKATSAEMGVMLNWVHEELQIEKVRKKIQQPKLSSEQVMELRELFKLYDLDGNGVLSKEELHEVTKGLEGIVEDGEVEKLVEQVEIDEETEKKLIKAQVLPSLVPIVPRQKSVKARKRSGGVSFEQFIKLFGRS